MTSLTRAEVESYTSLMERMNVRADEILRFLHVAGAVSRNINSVVDIEIFGDDLRVNYHDWTDRDYTDTVQVPLRVWLGPDAAAAEWAVDVAADRRRAHEAEQAQAKERQAAVRRRTYEQLKAEFDGPQGC